MSVTKKEIDAFRKELQKYLSDEDIGSDEDLIRVIELTNSVSFSEEE